MFTGLPAYQSFGRNRSSRRSAITPSIRIGPTFCELMKIANSVAAAIKMAAGSLTGDGRLGRGPGVISSGIEVVDEAQPLEHEALVHQLDHRRLGRGQPRQAARGHHPGGFAKLLIDARRPASA